jgi:hypothetical protein
MHVCGTSPGLEYLRQLRENTRHYETVAVCPGHPLHYTLFNILIRAETRLPVQGGLRHPHKSVFLFFLQVADYIAG